MDLPARRQRAHAQPDPLHNSLDPPACWALGSRGLIGGAHWCRRCGIRVAGEEKGRWGWAQHVWHGGDEATRLVLRRGRGAPWIFLRTRSADAAEPWCKPDPSSVVPSACSPAGLLQPDSASLVSSQLGEPGRTEVLWRQKRGGATVGDERGTAGERRLREFAEIFRSLPMQATATYF